MTIFRLKEESSILLKLGAPIVVTQVLQMAMGVTDTVMSGYFNALDLAAVSMGAAILTITMMLSLGLVLGLTPIVAQAHGASDNKKIVQSVCQTFWITIGASVFTCIVLTNSEKIFNIFDVNNEIRPVVSGYLNAISFGIPALFSYNVLVAYANGLSLTRPAMIASIVGLIINIPLNYILIYGKLGFPALGGVGCGWASSASFCGSFVIMVIYVSCSKKFSESRLFETLYKPNFILIKEQIILGLPISSKLLTEQITFTIIMLFLGGYGVTVVAAHQIVVNIMSLLIMLPLSISMVLTIRIGFLLGKGDVHGARVSGYAGLILGSIYSICISIGLYYLADSIVAFYTPDSYVKQLAEKLLTSAALCLIVLSVQATCAGALRGYKDTLVPYLTIVFSCWVLCLPVGYVLGMTDWFGSALKAEGFWYGLVGGYFIAAIIMLIRLKFLSCLYVNHH